MIQWPLMDFLYFLHAPGSWFMRSGYYYSRLRVLRKLPGDSLSLYVQPKSLLVATGEQRGGLKEITFSALRRRRFCVREGGSLWGL